MKLRERFLKKKHHYQGKAIGFRSDLIALPNGKTAIREYLDHPGAVAVVPLLAKDKIIMVKQYRYPVQGVTWELPAGKLNKRESPLSCVKRELEEETGYKGSRYKKLLSFWPTAAFANEIIHIFIADGLKPGRFNPDEDEFLMSAIWPIEKVLAAIKNGKIKDSKTIIGVLAYNRLVKKR